jgi:hypothetical protein
MEAEVIGKIDEAYGLRQVLFFQDLPGLAMGQGEEKSLKGRVLQISSFDKV